MRRKKLLWKVVPYYLIILVISIVVVWLYSSRSMRDIYLNQVKSDLQSRAELIANQVQDHVYEGRASVVDSLCKVLGRRSNTRVTIIAVDGTVLGDSDEDPSLMENHGRRPEVLSAKSDDVGATRRLSSTIGRRMMYVVVTMHRDNETIGFARTALPVTAIDQVLSALDQNIALVSTALLAVAILISLVVFRRISQPLSELRAGADRFARGELQSRVAVPDSFEMAALAEAMNRMASQLQERIRTIVEQRNEQEAVLSSMIEGVVAIDTGERVINLNEAAAEIFGVQREWSQNRSIQEVMRNVDLHGFVARALNSLEAIESEITLPGNEERYLHVHGSVLRDATGERTGVVVVMNDITRLKRLENIRREFVANVSHELKTPITSIRGFVETLLDGAMNQPHDAWRFLKIIIKQTNRLNAIVEDLLSLSRIEKESESREIELTRHELFPILTGAVQSCESRAQERQIRVTLDCPREISADINARYLEQAVINLIDNAIKYSEPNSDVLVFAKRRDEWVEVSVKDHGCGVAAEHLPRLFERFYRVDRARSRDVGGTGLGLAIVKHIARAHGGQVTVESKLGEGSTFTIRLPGAE